MKKADCLKPLHLIIITTLFNTSTILVFKGFIKSGRISFVTPIIAGALLFICSLGLFYVGKKYPGKSIYEVLEILFPKWIAVLLSFIYGVYAIYLLSRITKNTGMWISTVSLDKTPEIILRIFLLGLCAYTLWYGISVFGRFTILSGAVTIFAVILIFTMSIENIDTENFLPLYSNGIESVLSDILSFFVLPFGENLMLYNIYAKAEKKKTVLRSFSIGILTASVIISAVSFLTLSVLGYNSLERVYYPFYTTVSVIKSGNFLSRMEIVISASLILNILSKLCVCFYVATGFLKYLNKFKKSTVNLIVIVATLIISSILPSDAEGLKTHLQIYQIVAPFIQLGIPIAIFSAVLISDKRKRSNL